MTERSENRTKDDVLDINHSEIVDRLDALSDISTEVNPGVTTAALLERVCSIIVDTLPGADMAGVTLLSENGEPRTAAQTNHAVSEVDFNQYSSRQGPCLEAAHTRSVVRATVAESASRWPKFSAHLRVVGVSSFLSAPLWVDDRHAGALNIYSSDTYGFTEVDAMIVRVYTTSIESLLRVSKEVEFAKNEISGLNTAMKSRATIEQAKGILMALRGFSSESAFQTLVAESQRTQQKLSVVADQIVNRTETARRITAKQTKGTT